MKRTVLYVIATLVIATASGVAGYFYAKNSTSPATNTQQNTPNNANQNSSQQNTTNNGSQNNPQQNNTDNPQQYAVKVYFSKHPESDDDPSKVFPVDRTSPDSGVGKYAITQLLSGPTATEQHAGYFAMAKLRNDTNTCSSDFALTISSAGVATLQFCKTFDHIGSVSDGQAESELKATLMQFSTIKKVIILNKTGDCEFNLSGLNLCLQ